MPLNDKQIKAAKVAEKDFKLADEKGLFLLVTKSGSKLFRMKYRFLGKEKKLSFGSYPDVSLRQARDRRDEAKKFLLDGIDPAAKKRAEKATNLLRLLA